MTTTARTVEDRLIAGREITPSGCWEWTGTRGPAGYGQIHAWGRSGYTHRTAYVVWVGPIAEGLVIDHLCRNKGCFNPEHLDVVPQALNVQRGRGTKLTDTQVAEIRSLCDQGWVQRDIAKAYGVSGQHVWHLHARRGRTVSEASHATTA